MPILEIEEFERAARDDPEFTREIRYFDGQIELTAGEDTYLLAAHKLPRPYPPDFRPAA
jgi:hypothetical protein